MTVHPELQLWIDDSPKYRLVGLEPRGTGTAEVEALSSYLLRLAVEHWVTPTNLYRALSSEALGGNGKVLTNASRLDGYSKLSIQVPSVIEKFSDLEVDFTCLTLNSWRDAFASHGCGLLRDHQAWCEQCLRDDHVANLPRYNRLMWSMKCATMCPLHDRLLITSCPECGSRQAIVTANAQVGYCQACGSSLWRRSPMRLTNEKPTEEQRWKSVALANLLEAAQQGLSLNRVNFLSRFEEALTEYRGAPKTMAKELNLPADLIRSWVRRNHRPEFGIFLEFCYRLDLPPLSFFEKSASLQINRPREKRKSPRRRPLPLSADRIEIGRKIVRAVLNRSDDIQKLADVAAEANLTVRQLQYHLPDEYKSVVQRIFERRAREKQERDEKRIERVRRRAISLVRRGVYPSQRKILNSPGIHSSDIRLPLVKRALREIQDSYLRHHTEVESDTRFMHFIRLSRRETPSAEDVAEQTRLYDPDRRLR